MKYSHIALLTLNILNFVQTANGAEAPESPRRRTPICITVRPADEVSQSESFNPSSSLTPLEARSPEDIERRPGPQVAIVPEETLDDGNIPERRRFRIRVFTFIATLAGLIFRGTHFILEHLV